MNCSCSEETLSCSKGREGKKRYVFVVVVGKCENVFVGCESRSMSVSE